MADKLGFQNRVDLVRYALDQGLLGGEVDDDVS
jgi:DNA-binding CsgD family transcriptional regulator